VQEVSQPNEAVVVIAMVASVLVTVVIDVVASVVVTVVGAVVGTVVASVVADVVAAVMVVSVGHASPSLSQHHILWCRDQPSMSFAVPVSQL